MSGVTTSLRLLDFFSRAFRSSSCNFWPVESQGQRSTFWLAVSIVIRSIDRCQVKTFVPHLDEFAI